MRIQLPVRLPLWITCSTIALFVFVVAAQAQEEAPEEAKAIAPIPVASIAVQASTLESFLEGVEGSLTESGILGEIEDKLPATDAVLLELSQRTEERLERGYDRSDLDSIDAAWRSQAQDLDAWQSTLSSHLEDLDDHRSQLTQREAIWKGTAAAAKVEHAPPEVRAEVAEAQASLKRSATALRKRRDRALGIQKRVVALQTRAITARSALESARKEMLSHVLRRNQAPIWAWASSLRPESEGAQDKFWAAFDTTYERIRDYGQKASRSIWLHLFMIALLVWASFIARRWMGLPPLHGTRPVPEALTHPIAGGLLLGLSASLWIHADAPPRLGWILGVMALPFLYYVLRSLLPESLRRPMIGLVSVVLLDFARRVLMNFALLSDVMLVVEAALALAGLIWLRRPGRLAEVPRTESLFWVRVLGFWLHLVFLGTIVSLVGAILGFTSIADLLMSALIIGTYIAAVLFTAIRVVEAIAEAAVYSGKLDGIRLLRNHRRKSLLILGRFIRALGFATWVIDVLERLSLKSSARDVAIKVLGAPIGYGSVQITLGGLGAFAISIWVSWLLARFISTALEDEVFTRVSLPRGVPFALSTISRYTVLVLGFVVAIAVLGFEVSNLALLVSALGVGIGFGMQTMVNNFISGLILLFERPIKVGDLVSLDQLLGTVSRIGIRSSTIRSFDGADVIVPNGDLISNRVTNWTLADTRRRVTLPVGVTYGTPARKVIELLEEVAQAHPEILAEPPPYALFTGFGDSSLDFELRAWTESSDALTVVRSDVAVGVQEALAAAGIEVPFPQRDVYLKDAPQRPGEDSSGASEET